MIPEEIPPETLAEEQGLIYATVCDSYILVYRSTLVEDTDEVFRPVRELVDGIEPSLRKVVADPEMVFGEAEILMFVTGGISQREV